LKKEIEKLYIELPTYRFNLSVLEFENSADKMIKLMGLSKKEE
jgi:hypothetical protein